VQRRTSGQRLRELVWLALFVAFLMLMCLVAFTVPTGYRFRDSEGGVVFGWHMEQKRFQIFESAKLALDGPHVFVRANGYEIVRSVADDTGAWRLQRTMLQAMPAPRIEVPVDNPSRTRFEVTLRSEYPPDDGDDPNNPSRLLMLSDMEGQFDRFVQLLRAQGVIDADMHWRYGDGHIVLAGDFVDRGDDMVPLLWLIYRLEGEASAAGGRVHYVLGNHEEFAFQGDTLYWPPHLIATAKALGQNGHQQIFSQDSVLGRWLRSKPVIARVGDHLLVHGGISERFLASGLEIAAANATARQFYSAEAPRGKTLAEAAAIGSYGLTWYRGMPQSNHHSSHALEADPAAHLRAVLARYGVRRVAIGHTIADHVQLEQGGGLLRLDVHHASQTPEAALYENRQLWRVDAEGGRVRLD
jgi:Calcineurin-like phosphoesterase